MDARALCPSEACTTVYRQCKLAKRDHASLGAMLRLVDYWMTHALYMRTLTAATDFISALRPADMPDFEVRTSP